MKRQLLVACTLALAVFAAAPSFAISNGEIGIFGDTGLASCQATVPCNGTTTLFVYAFFRGASQGGITGAEYSIGESNPGGFLYAENYEPAAAVVGPGALAPLVNGVNIAYDNCNTGDGIKILLETVTVISNGLKCGEENRLVVEKHDNQSNDFFLCPLFTLCDAPAFTKVCLGFNVQNCQNPNPPFANDSQCSTSGEFILNPLPGTDCTVAVEETTWSKVKNLYN